MANIERCDCGMPHLGGTEHADECPVGVYVPSGGGSEVESLRRQLAGVVSKLDAIERHIASLQRSPDVRDKDRAAVLRRVLLNASGGQ